MDQPDALRSRTGDGGPDIDDGRLEAVAAPAVVAVVVTHDPGEWFEEALTSLLEQDYPKMSILVVDSGSATDPTSRVAAIAPRAFVHRVEENIGPARAVNMAMTMVEGTAFFLVCHDDVALSPSVVRISVEEAYRSNAGIVGPKLVRWDQPEALLSVGMGCDRFGAPSPRCERGELDQEQHDAVRDVFFIPGACFLVRADLLRALGGFDEAMPFHGEDADLCWRAHLAGARVVVAPSARVRHVEALGDRRTDDRRRLQSRHRLRMVLTNYGWFHLVWEGFQQAALSLVELVVALVTGRTRQAADVVGAWAWNLRRMRSTVAKRRRVRRARQVTDLELRTLQVRGSARLTAFARGQLGGGAGGETASLADAGRQWLSVRRSGLRAENVLIAVLAVFVLIVGSRHLFTQPLPAVAEFVPFPDRARDLLAGWWSGWRSSGVGAPAFAPFGLGLFGVLGLLAGGALGLVRWLAIVGTLPLGMLGAWRLGSVQPHSRAKAATLVAYGVNPLPYNALAAGSWRGLAFYAALPWIVLRLAQAAGVAPYVQAAGEGPTAVAQRAAVVAARPSVVRHVAAAALITALTAVVYPAAPLVVAAVVVALSVGSFLGGPDGRGGRILLIGLLSCLLAALLHLPTWYDALVRAGADVEVTGRFGSAARWSLTDLAHFDIGVVGRSPLTWGLLAAGLLSLAIGRSWRLAWAVRGWTLVAVPLGLVAVVQAGWWDVALPSAEVVLAPAALGLALAVGMGMAAFDVDLPVYRFGWRQFASVAAALGLALATLPVLVASIDGRWRMPRLGHDRVLAFFDTEAAETGPFRVLWLGAAESLPVAGWSLSTGGDDASVAATTFAMTIGYPDTSALWAGPENGVTEDVPELLRTAREGQANRLGRELGVMGVRYVAVLDRSAPAPFVATGTAASPWIDATLTGQLDLQEIDLNSAVRVYRNVAWRPLAVVVPEGVERPAQLPLDEPGAVTPALDLDASPQLSGSGALPGGESLHVAESADPGWRVRVDGRNLPRQDGFGWANRFDTEGGGPAELGFHTSVRHRLVLLAQVLSWLAVAGVALAVPIRWTPRGARRAAPRDVVIVREAASSEELVRVSSVDIVEPPLVDVDLVESDTAGSDAPTIDADRAGDATGQERAELSEQRGWTRP